MVLSTALLILGGALSLTAMLLLSIDNPGARLPWWRWPPTTTWRHRGLVLAALACGLLGVVHLDDHIGDRAWLRFIAVLLLPPLAVTGWHNTRLRRSDR
jgi:hypothetical protein